MAKWSNPQRLPDGVEFIMVGPAVSLQTVLRILWLWAKASATAILATLVIVVGVGLLVGNFSIILPFLPFLGMAWANPTSRSTGDIITSAIWNQDVVDNPQYLKDTLDALELNDLQAATGNYAMGGNKITGYGTPSDAADVADKGYVDAVFTTLAYDSGWFAVGKNNTYSKTHGLGGPPLFIQVALAAGGFPSGTDKRYIEFGHFAGTNFLNFSWITDTAVVIKFGNGAVIDHTDGDIQSGYARILAWK